MKQSERNYSNKRVNRLGKCIEEESYQLNDEDLDILQYFRLSFSKPLVRTFHTIRSISIKVHPACISAFRLKRIDTIINKARRQRNTEHVIALSQMGDVAGIRCIFYNEAEVRKFEQLIYERFESAGKTRDYLKEPKPIGYKSIHLYIKEPISKKKIEIQIRTVEHHNWATLVEITDLLYGLRLKELGCSSNPKIAEFHSLMSSEKALSTDEANLVYEVLHEYNYITNLTDKFLKNNESVRKQWSETNRNHSFFLIEASKDQIPKLTSFAKFDDAEEEYFKRYKERNEVELVLTSISNPNFKQISIAYANYILSYHTFIKDVEPIIKTLAIEAVEDSSFSKFKKIFSTYEQLLAGNLLEVMTETTGLFLSQLGRKNIIFEKHTSFNRNQEKIIRRKIRNNYSKATTNHRIFIKEIMTALPKNLLKRLMFKNYINKHSKRIKAKLQEHTVVINPKIN